MDNNELEGINKRLDELEARVVILITPRQNNLHSTQEVMDGIP